MMTNIINQTKDKMIFSNQIAVTEICGYDINAYLTTKERVTLGSYSNFEEVERVFEQMCLFITTHDRQSFVMPKANK